MVNPPSAPLTAVRTAPVPALVASMVTPGSTAPEVSCTMPLIWPVAWAIAMTGSSSSHDRIALPIGNQRFIARPP